MPHFAAVERAFSEERRRAALPDPDAPPRVRISIEPETEDTSAG
jgi:hypothetical protein